MSKGKSCVFLVLELWVDDTLKPLIEPLYLARMWEQTGRSITNSHQKIRKILALSLILF